MTAKVLANNIRSQVRKEREVINLISTETSNLEQETRRLQQGLNQLSKNHESQKVSVHHYISNKGAYNFYCY